MIHFTAIFIGILAITAAKPPPSQNGPPNGEDYPPPKGGPHSDGGHHHGDDHRRGPPHGDKHRGGPPHGGPHPEEPPSVKYAYDQVGRVAALLNMIIQDSNKDYARAHQYWMIESPNGLAIEEFEKVQNGILSNDFEECDNDKSVKDFMKQNAEVVNTCMAGWKLDTTLQGKTHSLLDTLKELDDQAKTQLENCKPGEKCYEDFLVSDLKKTIDEKLREIRQSSLVDIRLLTTSNSYAAVGDVARCVMSNTTDLLKEIYSAIASMNVCSAEYGLPPIH